MRKIILLIMILIVTITTICTDFIYLVKIKNDTKSRYGYSLDMNIIKMNESLIRTIRPLMYSDGVTPARIGTYNIYDVRYMHYYGGGADQDLFIILNEYMEPDKKLDVTISNYLDLIRQANYELYNSDMIIKLK